MEARVDLGDWLHTEMVYLPTVLTCENFILIQFEMREPQAFLKTVAQNTKKKKKKKKKNNNNNKMSSDMGSVPDPKTSWKLDALTSKFSLSSSSATVRLISAVCCVLMKVTESLCGE